MVEHSWIPISSSTRSENGIRDLEILDISYVIEFDGIYLEINCNKISKEGYSVNFLIANWLFIINLYLKNYSTILIRTLSFI